MKENEKKFILCLRQERNSGFFCFVSFSPPAHERNEVGLNRPSDLLG